MSHPGATALKNTPRIVPVNIVLDFRTTTSQNCGAVPRRTRIQGSPIVVSLNSGLWTLRTTTSQNCGAVSRRARI